MFMSLTIVSVLTVPFAVSKATASDKWERLRYIIVYVVIFPPLCVATYIVILVTSAPR
jgi:cytochrome c oxidase subunit IV